jgi:predicted outer membrane repeat protein
MLFNRGSGPVALGGWAVAAVLVIVGPSAAAGAIPGGGGGTASGGGVLYVDDDAPPGGDGQSWDTAFRYLQDALTEAYFGLGADEIRIGQGVYRPDRDEGGNVTPDDREATFDLIDTVALMGGYAGIGAPDPDERDIDLYETILSGDLAGDDEPGYVNYDENSLHVVMVQFVPNTVSLDGLTISGGNANSEEDEEYVDKRGGGAFLYESVVSFVDCTLSGNRAWNEGVPTEGGGGGLFVCYGAPHLIGCTFVSNKAIVGGGMELILNDAAVISECSFEQNHASSGGAILNSGSQPQLDDCSFVHNYAEKEGAAIKNLLEADLAAFNCLFADSIADWDGGAVTAAFYCDLVFSNCMFVGNSTPGEGGALRLWDSTATVTDSTFLANSACWGGATFQSSSHSQPTYTNCVFIANNGWWGGAIYDEWTGDSANVINCTFTANTANAGGAIYSSCGVPTTVSSSILYGDTATAGGDEASGTVEIYYSLVDGGWEGVGEHVIDADPRFVDVPGADGIVGTPDDDVRLLPGSPCIDAADNSALPPEIVTDLDGHPRYVDDPTTEDTGFGEPPIVDMGAYEYQVEESCPADFDDDGDVDTADLLFLLGAWGTPDGDVDGDGDTDTADLLALLGAWGECP